MRKFISVILFSIIYISHVQCQGKSVDYIVAVIGNDIVKYSDIEQQYIQMKDNYPNMAGDLKCQVFEDLLTQKLFINQAKIDSIEVSEAEVEMQLERRIDHFASQIGSREELEKYFNKSIIEIKDDFRGVIRDQLLTERMQQEVLGSVKITPNEVKTFYNNLSKDSIPYVNSQIEFSQIVIYPSHNEDAIFAVKEKLLDLRKRILNGEDFSTLAVLYSEDGSAPMGGEIGYLGKGQLDATYANAAFSLKKGGISKIVESEFGYHLIQLIDRKNDKVNTRHILMKPKVSTQSISDAVNKLDSITEAIRTESISFKQAAQKFSEDESTQKNGGISINPGSGSAKWEIDDLDAADYYALKKLNVGEISKPFKGKDEKGNEVYKIIQLNNRTEPHKANLKEDFSLIKNMAIIRKREELLLSWISEKSKTTFINIDESYQNCDFQNKNWVK